MYLFSLWSVVVVLVLFPGAFLWGADSDVLMEPVRPLGEWTKDCNRGFHLAAMPDAWSFAAGKEPLTVITWIAVDFERLPGEVYTFRRDRQTGERFFELTGYEFMALEAEIRSRATGQTVSVLPGAYSMDHPKDPVVFEWDGIGWDGTPVEPGFYEIEVKGRFVPRAAGIRASDGYSYRDFDTSSIVEEACTRTLTIEVVEELSPSGENEKDDRWTDPTWPQCDTAPSSYYSSVDATDPEILRDTLHEVIDDHVRFPYYSTSTDTWDILNDADQDASGNPQIITIYKNEAQLYPTDEEGNITPCSSGCSWNREHTWAKSYGFSEESGNGRIPYTDCHHLRAANIGYNSSRGNKPFDNCISGCSEKVTDSNNGFGGGDDVNLANGGSTSCGYTPEADDIWQVWDHRKGDVARTILYMDIRYEGGSGVLGDEQDLIVTSDRSLMRVETTSCGDGYQDPAYHGVLSTLLEWHAADPVDSDERRRNDRVWCYQQNRNPFVDHPEWVRCLYEGRCGLFGDGFETGDTGAWSITVP